MNLSNMLPIKTAILSDPKAGTVLADTGVLGSVASQCTMIAYNSSIPALIDLVVTDVGGLTNLLTQRVITNNASMFSMTIPIGLSIGQRMQLNLAADYFGNIQASICLA
jgi:hypothetical protein